MDLKRAALDRGTSVDFPDTRFHDIHPETVRELVLDDVHDDSPVPKGRWYLLEDRYVFVPTGDR